MATEKTVFDAWLAGAELPYDLLIPLLHEFGGADAVFSAWKKREEHPLFKAVPPACRKRMNFDQMRCEIPVFTFRNAAIV